MKLITTIAAAVMLAQSASALFTISLTPNGESTNVTLSGSSVATTGSYYLSEREGNLWDFFDNSGYAGYGYKNLGALSVEGSHSGNLLVQYFLFMDRGPSDDLEMIFNSSFNSFSLGETISGYGTADLNLPFSRFTTGRCITDAFGAPFELIIDDSPTPVSDTGTTLILVGLALTGLAIMRRVFLT